MLEFNATILIAMLSFIIFMMLMNVILYKPMLQIVQKRKNLLLMNENDIKENEQSASELAIRPPTANLPPDTCLKLSVIPLLFESHFESDYDIIVCVSSTEDRQIARMMLTRGYTREQADARLAAQMSVAEKAARADWTIHNDSTVEELRAEVQRCAAWLIGRMEKAT